MLAQTAIEVVILVIVMIIAGNASATFLALPFVIALLIMFSLGVGLIVSVWNVHYRDVSHLVGIAMNLLFYATPIIYPFSFVPSRIGFFPIRTALRLNPLTQFVNASRDSLYGLRYPSAGRVVYLALSSATSLAVGWMMFRRHAPDISEEM